MNKFVTSVTGDEISHFDNLVGIDVRAVRRHDTNITLFASELPRRVLYEVHILPESGEAFTPKLLERMCCNSIAELVQQFDPKTCSEDRTYTAVKKQLDLINGFAPTLLMEDARFWYGYQNTTAGYVVRIVFGTYQSMRDFEAAGFDLEPSRD